MAGGLSDDEWYAELAWLGPHAGVGVVLSEAFAPRCGDLDPVSDECVAQLVAGGAPEIAEYLNMRRWAAMCWRDDDGRPYG